MSCSMCTHIMVISINIDYTVSLSSIKISNNFSSVPPAGCSSSPVCSHNEWDPLQEVIVGRLDGATVPQLLTELKV